MNRSATTQGSPRRSAPELPRPEPICLIVNPSAGQKASITTNTTDPEDAERVLRRLGVPIDVRHTEYAGHGTELAREAVAGGLTTIVAAGGDGTVREVAAGLIGSPATLGILPFGSVMNVARSLNIPRDLEAAAGVIQAGRRVRMDVGRASASGAEHWFLEAAGAGVDAGLFAYANELDAGEWGSLAGLVRVLRKYRPRPVRLEVDERTALVPACLAVTIAIGPYTGLALTLAPDAKVDDRQFDVVVRERFGRWEFVLHLARIAGARRAYHPKMRTFGGRTVVVDALDGVLPVHADGDVIGTTPASFHLYPAALSVFAGEAPLGEPSAVAWQLHR